MVKSGALSPICHRTGVFVMHFFFQIATMMCCLRIYAVKVIRICDATGCMIACIVLQWAETMFRQKGGLNER